MGDHDWCYLNEEKCGFFLIFSHDLYRVWQIVNKWFNWRFIVLQVPNDYENQIWLSYICIYEAVLSLVPSHRRAISANGRRRCICNVFSHWRRTFSFDLHNRHKNSDTSVRTDFITQLHDDVTKWKYFPRYWPFVRGMHRSPVNSPHKCQWRGALMFSLICVWINDRVNNHEAGVWDAIASIMASL